jgi:two-component system LytT family response regulator
MSLRVAVLGQLPGTLLAQLADLAASMDLVVFGHAPDSASATAALANPAPDIAVVASTLSDGSGFAFVRELAAGLRPVGLVFVGAREGDAVTAFELQATDFVVLPAAESRLRDALTRAKQQVLQQSLLRTADELQRLLSEASGTGGLDLASLLRARVDGAAATGGGEATRRRRGANGASTGTLIASSPWRSPSRGGDGRLKSGRDQEDGVLDLSQEDGGRADADGRPLRVLVREGRRTRFVPLVDVDWFEADGNYIRVHTGGEEYRTRGTITAIETALDPRQFVRIHRRVVVNMDRVREMSPLPGGDGLLVLGDGSTLRLSRTYRSRVR